MESTDPAGLAAGICWDLSDLYAGPDDPAIEADLDRALKRAGDFASRHREAVASLSAADLAAAIDELESLNEPVVRAACYSQLLFAADTSDPRHGALMQRVQERISEIKNSLLFFELEWVAVDSGRADALLGDPTLAKRRHFLAWERRQPADIFVDYAANTP